MYMYDYLCVFIDVYIHTYRSILARAAVFRGQLINAMPQPFEVIIDFALVYLALRFLEVLARKWCTTRQASRPLVDRGVQGPVTYTSVRGVKNPRFQVLPEFLFGASEPLVPASFGK